MKESSKFALGSCTFLLFLLNASFANANCPAQFTNLGFNGDPFVSGVAPGWSGRVDPGVTPKRYTGAQYESGVAQGIEARNGWAQATTIYQTGTVCPGYEYEITVRAGYIYRSGPRWESAIGVAQGTVDRWEFVQSTSVIWGFSDNQNITTQATLRAVAASDTMTILIHIVLAWSDAWIDDIVITPISTVTLPPSPTPTITPTPRYTLTPTPTLPAELGPNVLVNGDFEAGFNNNIGTGWSSFTNASGGYFKENAKLGPMGGGIYGLTRGNEDSENIRMSSKVYLVEVGRYNMVNRLRQELSDDVLTIAKTDVEPRLPGDPLSDPESYGRQWADWWYDRSAQDNIWAHAYYGLNEPSMNIVEDLRKVARFELAFTRRLHERGLRSIVLNHSLGTPSVLEYMLLPEVAALLAEADYVGYHAYSVFETRAMCDTGDQDLVYRYDRIVQMYRDRNWRMPPLVWTEGGDHGIVPGGFPSPADVRDDLVCAITPIRQRPYLMGLCYFLTSQWPNMQWPDFDLTLYPEIIDGVRAGNRAHPHDAHSGTMAQQFGGSRESFDRGIIQSFDTTPGTLYIVQGWFQYTFFDGYPNTWPSTADVRLGWDPTGQTANVLAPTLQWTNNMIGPVMEDTDMWYPWQATFLATGNRTSLWIRARQANALPSVRVAVDDLIVRQVLSSAPGGTHISIY